MNALVRCCRAVWSEFCGLGRHTGVVVAAPTQHPEQHEDFKEPVISEKIDDTTQVIIEDKQEQEVLVGTSYHAAQRASWAGRFFDWVVGLAGTRTMFVIIFLILLGWAIAGIVLGAPDTWQVIMQDASSIQVRGTPRDAAGASALAGGHPGATRRRCRTYSDSIAVLTSRRSPCRALRFFPRPPPRLALFPARFLPLPPTSRSATLVTPS